jgi:Mor family transcriptional regulator
MKNPNDDFLLDLQTIVKSALTANSEQSAQVKEIIAGVVNNWGGLQPYIRKNEEKREQNTKRDHLLYQRFNGRNKRELCHEFGISEGYLYEIIRRVQNEAQADLFPKNETKQ